MVYQNTPLMDVYHHLGTTTWIKYTSPPIILCNTGSYGSCAITTTCATHTQFRHQRAELRRILPASTGDYQSRIFHHSFFFSSLQVSRDHYCREKRTMENNAQRIKWSLHRCKVLTWAMRPHLSSVCGKSAGLVSGVRVFAHRLFSLHPI